MQDATPQKRAIRKWPFILIAILAVLAGAAWYVYQKYVADDKWKPLLQAQLKELVLKSTDSLYHIEYEDFDLNIASGNITVKNFRLVPDTVVYQKLVTRKKAPDNLFILGVKTLSIKNVGASKAYKERVLDVSNIKIESPSLTVIHKKLDFNDTVKVGHPKTPYQLIKKTFKQLHIDSIALKDINVNYINKSNGAIVQNTLKHLDISINDFKIDSLSANDPSRFYYTKGIEIRINGYRRATPDSLYVAAVKQIYFSTALRKIILYHLSFLPRYNRTRFYEVAGESTDMFSLKFKRIAINDIDIQKFLRDQKLFAGVLDVNNADVDIYNNNAYHGRKTSKIGKDPHQALQKVALDMHLNQLNIVDAHISYAETDETTRATGEITFNHTNAHFYNITNDVKTKRNYPFMTANIHTYFMNVAPLQVNFKFNLLAKDGAFNYNGTLGRFDGRILDKLVKPLAMVHVKSADVEKLNFNINASNYSSKGHVEFYYKNLNVELLKKVQGKTELQKQNLISKLANTLIIDDDNPDKKGRFHPGPVDLKREPTTSFFSFLYKGILDGLKPSVGFDKKTETSVNKTIDKVSTLLDKYKHYREKRKQRREERRKARELKKQEKLNQ
jgi:hypothetical protein